MPDKPFPPRRFQFSLRTFLIATCAIGVGAGLLGRLCLQLPMVSLGVFVGICIILSFLLAIGTIFWLGLARRSAWSNPVCRKCRLSLYRLVPERDANCPVCGAGLAEAGAIEYPMSTARRWGLVLWAVFLLVMPFVGIGAVVLNRAVLAPTTGPAGLANLSTQELIQKRLPNQIDQPWVWNVLEARLAARALTQQDVDDAIKTLTAHMTTTRPQGWDRPLSWQSDFIKSAGQSGMVSEPVLIALCDAFHGPKPVVQLLPRLREGKGGLSLEVEYGSNWGRNANLGLQLVWQVNRVLLDDEPLDVRQTHKYGQSWSGRHDGGLAAGDHKLTIDIESAYIESDKLVGLNPDDLSKNLWPEARKQWTQTVSASLQVLPKDAQLVALVTNPGRHPGENGGIAFSRFVIQPQSDGDKLVVLKASFVDGLPIPLSYDVSAVLGDQTVDLGRMWVVQTENSRTSSGGQMQKRLDELDSSVRRADIILTPNPAHIEHRPEVSEIWGEQIIIRNVPLERLDLE